MRFGQEKRPPSNLLAKTLISLYFTYFPFHNFYDAKEELKSLSNRDNMYTVIGGIKFRAYSNLTTKWLKESEFHGWIWAICIDLDLDGTDNCFPLNPTTTHEA